jgi:hypothetical protein
MPVAAHGNGSHRLCQEHKRDRDRERDDATSPPVHLHVPPCGKQIEGDGHAREHG